MMEAWEIGKLEASNPLKYCYLGPKKCPKIYRGLHGVVQITSKFFWELKKFSNRRRKKIRGQI